ncbi:hypothetical protein DRN43_02380 [Thermococci archaeon]|nr:MAG: hypothetical protein DRN41_01890 [Thermococci archaeon]RLF90114.1 MAG: hypothetical protein DRN43_02380 [Thermococci archaeon]
MVANRTIKVEPEVKNLLDKMRMLKRETYNDIIERLIKERSKILEKNRALKEKIEDLERENKELRGRLKALERENEDLEEEIEELKEKIEHLQKQLRDFNGGEIGLS